MYNLPGNFNEKVDPNSSSKVELPFKFLLAYWQNGNSQMSSLASTDPVLYFGGWNMPQAMMEECKEEFGGELKGGVYSATRTNNKGEQRVDFASRRLAIAPIGYRKGWFLEVSEGGRSRTIRQKEYKEGYRQFLQMVVYLFSQEKNEAGKMAYTPWGVGMLSVKGWQVTYLLDALREFETATLPARTALREKFGKVPPYNAFVLNVGTFGKEIHIEQKGKGKAVSPVTPIMAGIPAEITVEDVERWYVGDETAFSMGEYYVMAEEWLAVLEKGQETFGGESASDAQAPAPVVDDAGDDPF